MLQVAAIPATALLPARAQIRMKELGSSESDLPSKTEHFHPTADTQVARNMATAGRLA
jgi:hypothetical protein